MQSVIEISTKCSDRTVASIAVGCLHTLSLNKMYPYQFRVQFNKTCKPWKVESNSFFINWGYFCQVVLIKSYKIINQSYFEAKTIYKGFHWIDPGTIFVRTMRARDSITRWWCSSCPNRRGIPNLSFLLTLLSALHRVSLVIVVDVAHTTTDVIRIQSLPDIRRLCAFIAI